MKRNLISAAIAAALIAIGAGAVVLPPPATAREGQPRPAPSVSQLRVQVLSQQPHAVSSFTEGYQLADGRLYESTGLYGKSALLEEDPATSTVLRRVPLDPHLFAEGITVVGDRIWLLTYQEGVAIQLDRATLTTVSHPTYTGQGWGLCFDGRRLIMSNGTDTLTFRDPKTFAVTGQVHVRVDGVPVTNINELECTTHGVWANIFGTDRIIRIDVARGTVTAAVDASGLFTSTNADAVLNGIAAIPGTDQFLITGKTWPKAYRVKFVAQR
jgi:glutamine cyclotransferase